MQQIFNPFLIVLLSFAFGTARADDFRGIQFTPIHFDNNLNINGHAFGILENAESVDETDLTVKSANFDSQIAKEQTSELRTGYLTAFGVHVNVVQGKNQLLLPGNSRTAFGSVSIHERIYDAPFNSDVKTSRLNEKHQGQIRNGAEQNAYLDLANAYTDILITRYRVSLAIQNYFSWIEFMDGPFANSNPSEDDKREARLYEVKIFNDKHNLMKQMGDLHIKYKDVANESLSDVLIKEPLPYDSTWTLEESQKVALANNPQYLALKSNEEISGNAQKRNSRGALPTVSLDSTYGRIQSVGGKGFGQDYDLNVNNYNVSAGANVDLNFAARRDEAKILALQALKAQTETEKLKRTIQKEIETTFNSYTQNVAGLNNGCSGLSPLILQYNQSVTTYTSKGDMRLQDLLKYRVDLFLTADDLIVRFGRMIQDSFLLYQQLGLMTEEQLNKCEYAETKEKPFGLQSQILLNPANFRVPNPSPLDRLLERCTSVPPVTQKP